ncbi:hypothetical protein [Kitasatospora sp. NPDC088779]
MFLADPYSHDRDQPSSGHRASVPPQKVSGTGCPICGARLHISRGALHLLALTAQGLTARTICRRSRQSLDRVTLDLAAAAAELGAANPEHAVDIALRGGLLPFGRHWLSQAKPLSQADLTALRLMADGLTSREIGQRTRRTARAVDTGLQRILTRHGWRTRGQAVERLHAADLLDRTHPCRCVNDTSPGTATT